MFIVFAMIPDESFAYGKKFQKGLLYGYLLAKINQVSRPPM